VDFIKTFLAKRLSAAARLASSFKIPADDGNDFLRRFFLFCCWLVPPV